MIFNSTIAAVPSPSISRRRSGRADTTSANEPKRAMRALASGLTSRRGMAQLEEATAAYRARRWRKEPTRAARLGQDPEQSMLPSLAKVRLRKPSIVPKSFAETFLSDCAKISY
jgi:hypothetical protein